MSMAKNYGIYTRIEHIEYLELNLITFLHGTTNVFYLFKKVLLRQINILLLTDQYRNLTWYNLTHEGLVELVFGTY